VQIGLFSFLVVGGYFLGSFPTGFLVARALGIDLRTVGSGNIGATNAFRILGKGPGATVLLVDALKGYAACLGLPWIARSLGWVDPAASPTFLEWMSISAGVAAVLGHNYTCWLKFKGGKGIATSAGVLLALVPWAFLGVLVVFLVVFSFSRYVSLGSLAAAASLPVITWATGQSLTLISMTSFLSALAIYKHRANISRLLNGTENRIGGKPREVRK
jgi:glycerol-3-phosphate acyltransferase PlsY